MTPNDPYSGRTALLTSKLYILYIYSTNIGTEYFKHSIYSPSFPLQNAVCFIILTYLVSVLFAFSLQGVLKLKKNNSGAKRLSSLAVLCCAMRIVSRDHLRTVTSRTCHFYKSRVFAVKFTASLGSTFSRTHHSIK